MEGEAGRFVVVVVGVLFLCVVWLFVGVLWCVVVVFIVLGVVLWGCR